MTDQRKSGVDRLHNFGINLSPPMGGEEIILGKGICIMFDVAVILKRTLAWNAKTFDPSEVSAKDVAFSDKAKEAAKIINKRSFGCYQKAVVHFAGALLGEDLRTLCPEYSSSLNLTGGISFQQLVVVVPNDNPNSHNYELNKPTMIFHKNDEDVDHGMKTSGVIGNHLPNDSSHYRPATEEDVTAYITELNASLSGV